MAKQILNASDKWMVFVNPNAGNRKGEKDWDKIYDLFEKSGIAFDSCFTKHKEHGVSLTSDCIKKGYRKFIVAGGDGTLNEVANGIFYQKDVPTNEFLIAMIPVGTGNDWCRMFNIPYDYEKAINLIKNEKTFLQDVGKINYFYQATQKNRYFINVAGMGYDAVVASKTNYDKERGRGGSFVYLKNLFTSLLFYKHTTTEIILDENKTRHKNKTFSLSVGIGKYNGGGMKQLPFAIADDGLFDVTLMKKLGKFTVMKEVKNLYDGSFINHPKVETFKGKHIKINSTPPINLEADGESLGHSPFVFEIIPKSLRIVTGEKD